MIHSSVQDGNWTLEAGGELLAQHSAAQPFATVIRREKTYTANRGTYKEEVREVERMALSELRREGDRLVFSAGGHELTVRVEEIEKGARLALQGEAGLAYEFRLPAPEGEAVFGGGEQYRQVNLRGETVKNFVSEHIKASTIVEKALLPRALYREKPHASIGSYAPMPVFVTDRGRLIRFETDSDGASTFAEDCFRFEFDACPRSLTLQKGRTGRAATAPSWATRSGGTGRRTRSSIPTSGA